MPIAPEDLDEHRFIDDDGNLLDPAATPFVLMPDPNARDSTGPCQLWIVIKGGQGYHPTEVEMESWQEAERACDDANFPMGWSREEADRIILASMSGGTA